MDHLCKQLALSRKICEWLMATHNCPQVNRVIEWSQRLQPQASTLEFLPLKTFAV